MASAGDRLQIVIGAKDELSAVGRVTKIEPIADPASQSFHFLADQPSRRARVDTPDDDIHVAQISGVREMLRDGSPMHAPEQVQATHRHDGFIEADLRCAKRLADGVRW